MVDDSTAMNNQRIIGFRHHQYLTILVNNTIGEDAGPCWETKCRRRPLIYVTKEYHFQKGVRLRRLCRNRWEPPHIENKY